MTEAGGGSPGGGWVDGDLLARGRAWLQEDPDAETTATLETLLHRASEGEAAALAELSDAFDGTLEFGTAGLRGAMGPGPNRMNRLVVIRAAAGLASYLRDRLDDAPDGAPARAVVGFDARHGSAQFARDTASVLTGAGVQTYVLPRALPTPVLAFALRHLGCDAGVMVTASHNPPQDNGYKVYLGGRLDVGAQIVPPADADIAGAIDSVGSLDSIIRPDDGWTTLGDDVLTAYLSAAAAVASPGGARELDVVLTPLHGVGGTVAVQALSAAGFAEPYVVPAQAWPDPDFPTTPFPNPEEAGALDLAIAAAAARGADLVVANDPDADRCAVAVPDPATGAAPSEPAGWRMLTGDEVGALLGSQVAARHQGDGSAVLACSIVSSSLLGRIAAAQGVGFTTTLTGFKWISRPEGLVFGYEEALGYCVDPSHVRDKDGVSAAVLVCELAAGLKAAGRTLLDALDELAVAHGVHATAPLTIRVTELREIGEAMARLRSNPPQRLGGSVVTSIEDLAAGLGDLPPTDALRYRTADGSRVVVRPSGTEPKLKCYLEAVVPVDGPGGSGGSVGSVAAPGEGAVGGALGGAVGGLPAARAEATRRLTALRADIGAAITPTHPLPPGK